MKACTTSYRAPCYVDATGPLPVNSIHDPYGASTYKRKVFNESYVSMAEKKNRYSPIAPTNNYFSTSTRSNICDTRYSQTFGMTESRLNRYNREVNKNVTSSYDHKAYWAMVENSNDIRGKFGEAAAPKYLTLPVPVYNELVENKSFYKYDYNPLFSNTKSHVTCSSSRMYSQNPIVKDAISEALGNRLIQKNF